MRLIDADEFIEYLGLNTEDSREINLSSPVSLEDFDRQPTAYDVDMILARLELLLENAVNADLNTYEEKAAYCTAYSKTIEVVKEEFERCKNPEREG